MFTKRERRIEEQGVFLGEKQYGFPSNNTYLFPLKNWEKIDASKNTYFFASFSVH